MVTTPAFSKSDLKGLCYFTLDKCNNTSCYYWNRLRKYNCQHSMKFVWAKTIKRIYTKDIDK